MTKEIRRVTYALTDHFNEVRARLYSFDDNPPELDPWMAEAIKVQGWNLIKLSGPGSTSTISDLHGHVDWQGLADELASVLKSLLQEEDMDEMGGLIQQAEALLADHQVAHMEIGLGLPTVDVEEEGAEDAGQG